MKNSLSFFIIGFGLQAAAADCLYQGKKVDIYSSEDRKNLDGKVVCDKTTYIYKKGHKIEEIIETPQQKHHFRFFDGNDKEWRHGEQTEFYPGTQQVQRRERLEKMHKVGLQESFYKSGKIQTKSFYVQENPQRSGSEASSIGYHENGEIQFLRCAKVKAHTLDPKLCGYEGPSTVKRTDGAGNVKATITYLNGQIMEEEKDAPQMSAWAPVVQSGTNPKPAAVKTKKENHGTQQKLTTLYANGKTKRETWVDENGRITGVDSEFFESGKLVRKTNFENGKATSSECFWENGKPRAKIQTQGEAFQVEFTWDSGVVEVATKLSLDPSTAQYNNPELELMLLCSGIPYGFYKEGPSEVKRRDGSLVESGKYKAGRPLGWLKLYSEKGELMKELLYSEKTNERDSFVQAARFYENGKLSKEEKYNSDGSIGP